MSLPSPLSILSHAAVRSPGVGEVCIHEFARRQVGTAEIGAAKRRGDKCPDQASTSQVRVPKINAHVGATQYPLREILARIAHVNMLSMQAMVVPGCHA